MPVIVPNGFPAIEVLAQENIHVMIQSQSEMLQKNGMPKPLRICFLNLMPLKQPYELQMIRQLSACPLPVEFIPMKLESHETHHGEEMHIERFYKGFQALKSEHYDGLMLTGAPVELLEFEDVDYWPELCEIMDWARTNVTSSFYLCWGALAALYYHFGIKKIKLPRKIIGVYDHMILQKTMPLVQGMNDWLTAPHTRETGFRFEDIYDCSELTVVAASKEAGPGLCMAHEGREIFMMGHHEYDSDTIHSEYVRDVGKGMDVALPPNFYIHDDVNAGAPLRWRADGSVLYTNWISHYAAKGTPWYFEQT